MRTLKLYTVLTTIQPPTPSVFKLCRQLCLVPSPLLIIGDQKGPMEYPLEGTELFTLERQLSLPLRLPSLVPVNHYARKNIGYLVAINRGAEHIYEADDDNMPAPSWQSRTYSVQAREVTGAGWCNVYQYFSDHLVWPRGLPLDQVLSKRPPPGQARRVSSPIQQGLVDGNPDVDAIWRMIWNQPLSFKTVTGIALSPGVWCPFNSQNTWWWPEAYPLMYLPSFCTFRMTDIWRSFVAQRCLWALGSMVTFHSPDVVQERNKHNLIEDFRDEVPGHLANQRMMQLLEVQSLKPGREAVGDNLVRCYEVLIRHDFLPRKEMDLIEAWLTDLKSVADGLAL